jgi:hypothetical protein
MNTTFDKILNDALVGKKCKHQNQHYRDVTLEIESVKAESNHVQVTPDTQANDWYGDSYTTRSLIVTFVDGSTKEFQINSEICIVD